MEPQTNSARIADVVLRILAVLSITMENLAEILGVHARTIRLWKDPKKTQNPSSQPKMKLFFITRAEILKPSCDDEFNELELLRKEEASLLHIARDAWKKEQPFPQEQLTDLRSTQKRRKLQTAINTASESAELHPAQKICLLLSDFLGGRFPFVEFIGGRKKDKPLDFIQSPSGKSRLYYIFRVREFIPATDEEKRAFDNFESDCLLKRQKETWEQALETIQKHLLASLIARSHDFRLLFPDVTVPSLNVPQELLALDSREVLLFIRKQTGMKILSKIAPVRTVHGWVKTKNAYPKHSEELFYVFQAPIFCPITLSALVRYRMIASDPSNALREARALWEDAVEKLGVSSSKKEASLEKLKLSQADVPFKEIGEQHIEQQEHPVAGVASLSLIEDMNRELKALSQKVERIEKAVQASRADLSTITFHGEPLDEETVEEIRAAIDRLTEWIKHLYGQTDRARYRVVVEKLHPNIEKFYKAIWALIKHYDVRKSVPFISADMASVEWKGNSEISESVQKGEKNA